MIDVFKPIEIFANYFVYDVFKLKPHTHVADSLQFFIYDTIKIFILILIISFAVGFIKSYFTPEKTKKYLNDKHVGIGNRFHK